MVKKRAKTKAGQPTKYKPAYAFTAEKLCSEKGYTDENLATHFKVSAKTIANWKRKYLPFLQSIKKGKDEFDTEVVEQCLLKRCKGYTYVEITRELQTDYEDKIESDEGSVQTLAVTKKVTKQVVPDVTAHIFWLCNRNSKRWKNRKSHEVTGEDGGPIPVTIIDYSKVDLARKPNGSNSPK